MPELTQLGIEILTMPTVYHYLLCAALVSLGLVISVHLICTANFLPPDKAPWHITLLVALGVASAVGMIHGGVTGNLLNALLATVAACAALIFFNIAAWAAGFHICRHFETRALS